MTWNILDYLLLSLCAPTCTSDWSCAQALGTLRASSPRIYPVLFLQGADAETTSGPALGVMGGYRPLVWED